MRKQNNDVLLLGCGGHARFILSILNNNNYKVSGFIDLGESFNSQEVIMNIPVIGCRPSLPKFSKQGFKEVILAIGDNIIRKELFTEVKALNFKTPNIIHSSAIVDQSVLMGTGNVIGPNVIIGAEVKIGSNNIFNSASIIEHQSVIGSHSHISLSAIICGFVNIGDGVLIGANSTVIDKKYIADNSIVGSGTNVIDNITENDSTFVGNPARIVKK